MEAAVASIIVASIGTVGTVIVALIHKFMKSNASDHSNVRTILEVVRGDIGRVDGHLQRVDDHMQRIEEKLDDHIGWHLDEK